MQKGAEQMADFDKEFFEGVKDGVTKGKIE